MDSLEISAKTVEEAIQRALKHLGVGREEVEVTVVKEGRAGLLGLGADEAVVRVTPLMTAPDSSVAEIAGDILERLLGLMGVVGSIVPQETPSIEDDQETAAVIAFDIEGDDLGILIGRRGQTLSGLQFVLRLMVGNQTKSWAPIVIDVGGYKRRRHQALESLARQMAEQVLAREVSVTLEPMTAYERRIIHLTLSDHPDITTESIGQGEARRVVIFLQE